MKFYMIQIYKQCNIVYLIFHASERTSRADSTGIISDTRFIKKNLWRRILLATKLQQYFPNIRSRNEILDEIYGNQFLKNLFFSWTNDEREKFLDYCTGVRGVKLLYDTYFKEALSPEITPERLEDFLSLLLKKKVRILQVLPNDSIRISNEETLLVTDIIVELEDGTIANIEMQKIGYLFPGQRSACYGADLLLRQYKRVRSAQKEKFSYKDIKDVYVIVFFENSTKEFHKFQDTYFHCFEQKSDTGLELELLEKFIFIPLDIFKENIQNKRKKNKLDAWLAFLSMDDPDEIISLITEYPEFKPLYQHIYDMCQNVERMMGMFSEELRIMDRNTVRYMIDQMQQELIENTKKLEKQSSQLQEQTRLLQEKDTEIQNLLNKLQKIESVKLFL